MNPSQSPNPRPAHRTAYALLALGFVIGAVSMASVKSGIVATPAFAQSAGADARLAAGTTAENLTELRNLDNSFANLASFVGPAVVDIKASTDGTRKDGDGARLPSMSGEGSGFIFRPDGYIITNDHVVGDFDKVTVTLRDGREYRGKVTRAQDSDIALVKIDAKDLPSLSFADSAGIRPGEFVMAVGAPFGLENSVTIGHISALHRSDTQIQGRLYPDLIQTDASINMGNSGGPLVNIDGRVVGINTAIYSPSGSSAGIGFAIPSNQARLISDLLMTKGKISRAMIGIYPETLKEYRRKELNLEGGAVVVQAPNNGPAGMAGIMVNDVIVRVADTPIKDSVDLRNSMLKYEPGQKVEVEYFRDGKREKTMVTLKAAPKPEIAKPAPSSPRTFRFGPDGQDPLKGFDLPPGMIDPFGDQKGSPAPDAKVLPLEDGQPRLGVGVDNLSEGLRKQFHVPASTQGVLVSSVVPGSVADKAGLRVGDVILELGTGKVSSVKALRDVVASVKKGQSMSIRYVRYTATGKQEVQKTVVF